MDFLFKYLVGVWNPRTLETSLAQLGDPACCSALDGQPHQDEDRSRSAAMVPWVQWENNCCLAFPMDLPELRGYCLLQFPPCVILMRFCSREPHPSLLDFFRVGPSHVPFGPPTLSTVELHFLSWLRFAFCSSHSPLCLTPRFQFMTFALKKGSCQSCVLFGNTVCFF